jgi:UDP-2,3-diacylglucosamine pyrophosphatase LpxH
MKKTDSRALFLASALFLGFLFLASCRKETTELIPEYLSVTFPTMELEHGLYYRVANQDRVIEMIFDQPVDTGSVTNSITLSDKNGPITAYDIVVSGSMVYLDFMDGFTLNEGWRYFLTLGPGLRSSATGIHCKGITLEIRTTGQFIGLPLPAQGTDTLRDAMAIISDVHFCLPSANTGNYSMFGKNAAALESFLDFILRGNKIKEVIIQGDIFDEWMVPFRDAPFDSGAGIRDSRDYFLAVANNPVNLPSVNKFREIALHPELDLIYVPGNHDMLMTREVLEEIIPGVQWEGDVPGLGKYIPANKIIMEHGHRYDFFNCPQPLVNPPHMLPPGYFITRFYASCVGNPQLPGYVYSPVKSSWMFNSAWILCFVELLHQYQVPAPPMDSAVVNMSGIDGYLAPFSFEGARQMYADSIEPKWPATQQANGVPVPISVFVAILNSIEVGAMSYYEYLNNSPGHDQYNIVSFGHTHNPGLTVYPAGSQYKRLYANSGSWVDQDKCSKKVRTFLVIKPAAWSGSDLNVVMLYQYNPVPPAGSRDSTYVAELIAEENIPD